MLGNVLNMNSAIVLSSRSEGNSELML